MSARQRLADRRASGLFEFEHRGMRFHASFSRFPDGRLGEILVTGPKAGTDLAASINDAALLASVAMQCGADVTALAQSLGRDGNGEPSTPIGRALQIIVSLGDER